MQGRIDRLEALVLSLMTNGAQSPGPAAAARALSMSASSSSQEYLYQHESHEDDMVKDEDEDGESETEEVAKSLGILRVDNSKSTSMYVGDAHWGAILNDVSTHSCHVCSTGSCLLDFGGAKLFPGAQETIRRA